MVVYDRKHRARQSEEVDAGESHTYRRAKTGTDQCDGHLGEIFQGVAVVKDTHLMRCLVTLPCNAFQAKAKFLPNNTGSIRVHPAFCWKALRAAELTLERLNRQDVGGELAVTHNIPGGAGCGSSTACCVASCRAVADALGVALTSSVVASIVVAAEEAADSIMFPADGNAMLFAHRKGCIVEHLPGPLPLMQVYGVNLDATGNGVDTLTFRRARYEREEIEQHRALIGMLRHGCRTGDLEAVALVATASARINQRFLEKPCFEQLVALGQYVGALGLNCAHSGTVAGFLFAPDRETDAKMDVLEDALTPYQVEPGWRFTAGASQH